ncbi:hypothetical protein ENSA5_21750 [Enhygromyxa salina]|uniref:Uncharacterized protein n=1 Tax=Enhygromyxa salina TaxID=215803 RepID=A0A2S9YBQ0_9BACT|nr:hypothetical protein [Enhygromyxa salina]PRQ02530.1 hypothetical protein ENSA5_21750 [Enhygromyxa salina]
MKGTSAALVALVCAAGLACEAELDSAAPALVDDARVPGHLAPRSSLEGSATEVDPCTEVGVIVPRLSLELHAPRTGLLRGGGPELHLEGEPVYEVEAGDDVASLAVQRAELAEAKATRERYAAEQRARARELRGAEQLGEHLAGQDRDAAREAHSISTREFDRAEATRRAAAARLEAQRARIHAGQLEAPFSGRLVREQVIPGAWVEAGQLLGRFASTEDLVLRVGLPAELAPAGPIEVRWRWPGQRGQAFEAVLAPARTDVDELSGLRLYEASVDPRVRAEHAFGEGVIVELPSCHGRSVSPLSEPPEPAKTTEPADHDQP